MKNDEYIDRFGQVIRDMSEGDQAELRSLRGHLDTDVVARMRVLEHACAAGAHYLNTAKTPLPNPQAMNEALGIFVLALDRAGYRV